MIQNGRALTKHKVTNIQTESVEKAALIRYFESLLEFTLDRSETNELAKDIWNRPWSEERRNDWERWLALAANSDVPMMKNAAKTIGKRLYGILNAMRHRVSNGNAEALNSKIRLLRIKARGYRNRERFKLGVMFHYGKLNMAF